MTDNTELVKRYQDALKATGKARVLLYGADLDSAADALGDVEDFISELREELSRIRAETAKNSGEPNAIAIIEARLPLYTDLAAINALKECISSIRSASLSSEQISGEYAAAFKSGAMWMYWANDTGAKALDKAASDFSTKAALTTPDNSSAPLKMLVANERLKEQILNDPDVEVEAGVLHPEAPANSRAKNSEEVVACHCTLIEQDESCPIGYPSLLCDDCDGKGHVAATPANSRAEAIGIKPLEWENLGGGVYKAPSPLFGSIRIEPCGSEYCVTWTVPGMCNTFTKGFFGTPEAAKAAAQADYEQRIRSALLQQEGE